VDHSIFLSSPGSGVVMADIFGQIAEHHLHPDLCFLLSISICNCDDAVLLKRELVVPNWVHSTSL
jgi:hypothetical protein